MKTIALFAAMLLWIAGHVASAQDSALPRQPAPAGASVFIISPADGATLTSPVTVQFGLAGMGVAPAGIVMANTGHHHLLIDVDTLPPDGLPLPATDQVRHFGAGQTQTTIELSPGRHTLQLVLGDHLHIPHQPPVRSERITITVSGN